MIPFSGKSVGRTFRPKIRVVIPARLASTRLPRKMLLAETGKTLIQHTYEAVLKAKLPDAVCIATDDASIAAAVKGFGGECYMTSADLRSGTDRVAAVARVIDDAEILVNVQGDEPEVSGAAIDAVIETMLSNFAAQMATAATPIRQRDVLNDPSCVKVVFDSQGKAMYFSRSPIPHMREWSDEALSAEPAKFHLHLGMYAYRRDFLLQLAQLPSCDLEQTEKLEQLRVLHAGHSIHVAVVDHAAAGIDTPEDYRAFVSRTKIGLRKAG